MSVSSPKPEGLQEELKPAGKHAAVLSPACCTCPEPSSQEPFPCAVQPVSARRWSQNERFRRRSCHLLDTHPARLGSARLGSLLPARSRWAPSSPQRGQLQHGAGSRGAPDAPSAPQHRTAARGRAELPPRRPGASRGSPGPAAPPRARLWAGAGRGIGPGGPGPAPPCRSRRQPAAAPSPRPPRPPGGAAAARRCPMGGLLSGVSFKEPTTVEDCDSTWETDSEPEAPEPGGEPRRQQQQQQQQEGVCTAAGGGEEPPAADDRPEEPPRPPEQGDRAEGDAGGPEQVPPALGHPRVRPRAAAGRKEGVRRCAAWGAWAGAAPICGTAGGESRGRPGCSRPEASCQGADLRISTGRSGAGARARKRPLAARLHPSGLAARGSPVRGREAGRTPPASEQPC